MIRRFLASLLVLAGLSAAAIAQIPGNFPSGSLYANSSAASQPGTITTPNAWLNRWCSSVGANFPLRGSGSWGCVAMSGDATMSNAGVVTLATVNANVGSFGSATQCVSITVNAKGLITAASAAACNPFPTATRAGDIIYWNGSIWTNFAGNNSGTNCFNENSSGVPSWLSCVSSLNTLTGALVITPAVLSSGGTINMPVPHPMGRLTLQSATPVMIVNQTGKGTIYYDCYLGGNLVPYFDGTNDQVDTISGCEVSTVMVSAASAGQVVSGQLYDIWWVHSGANRICLAMSASSGGGGGWASDTGGSNTARGTGFSQLDYTTRPYITNKNAITNCFNAATNYGSISANRATHLGTAYATANGQTGMAFTSAGTSGGTNPILGLFNAYNKVLINGVNQDAGGTYTYASATWRQCRGSASNQISFVDGLQQSNIFVSWAMTVAPNSTGNPDVGLAIDWVSGGANGWYPTSTGGNQTPMSGSGTYAPQIGFHYIACVENQANGASGGMGYGGGMIQTISIFM